LTVNVAAAVVAEPQVLVNTARYCRGTVTLPIGPTVMEVVTFARGTHLVPESKLSCHRTVGTGEPLAAAVKVACPPAQMVWSEGEVVTTGAVLTVKAAAVVVAVPQLLVKTARYCLPLSPAAAVKL